MLPWRMETEPGGRSEGPPARLALSMSPLNRKCIDKIKSMLCRDMRAFKNGWPEM